VFDSVSSKKWGRRTQKSVVRSRRGRIRSGTEHLGPKWKRGRGQELRKSYPFKRRAAEKENRSQIQEQRNWNTTVSNREKVVTEKSGHHKTEKWVMKRATARGERFSGEDRGKNHVLVRHLREGKIIRSQGGLGKREELLGKSRIRREGH